MPENQALIYAGESNTTYCSSSHLLSDSTARGFGAVIPLALICKFEYLARYRSLIFGVLGRVIFCYDLDMEQLPPRQPISDKINSMLQQESGNICPLCGKFERTGQEFTNHHINHDRSQSVYWNLIKICQECHDDLTHYRADGVRLKRVKQVKKNLFRRYFGAEAYKALLLAYKNNLVTATPVTALELKYCGYLAMHSENILTVGPATNVSTFDTYSITLEGKEIVENLVLAENNAH